MTKHTSWAIALTATTFLSAPAIAASLTPTLEENSAFAYSEGSESDYNFTLQEADADGKLSTKYYKIDLKPETFSTSPRISWAAVGEDQKDAADVVEVKLPNDQVKYFKYTYTQPEGRTVYNARQQKLSGNIDADFVGNVSDAHGGAIYNDYSSAAIENLTGDFVNNENAPRTVMALGGAIYNYNASIKNILGDFTNNSLTGSSAEGGALYNRGTINEIEGDFVGNSVSGSNKAVGGAVSNANQGTINVVNGNFIANHLSGKNTYGGAISIQPISDSGTIHNITGDFIGNYAIASNEGSGGALHNHGGAMKQIVGDFINNYVSATSHSKGGAIDMFTSSKNHIIGDFIGNHALSVSGGAYGGAFYGNKSDIEGNFIANYVQSTGGAAGGGAVSNNTSATGFLNGDFVGNFVLAGKNGYGGAIYNSEYYNKDITGNFIANYVIASESASGGAVYIGNRIMNSDAGSAIGRLSGSLLNNYAKSTSASALALGGAVMINNDFVFVANGQTHFMSGNYTEDNVRGKLYNSVFVYNDTSYRKTSFSTANGGIWVINDNIEGNGVSNGAVNYSRQYNISFTGDDTIDTATGTTTQYIAMNNDIINAGEVTVSGTTLRFGSYQHEDQTAKNWDGKGAFVASLNADGTANRDAAAVTSLSLNNAVFDIANGYLETVKLKGYSATDSFLHIDVDPDNMTADELHIAGNVEGVTKMIVHASSNTDIRGKGGILFAQSENDTTGNAGSFVVSRVYKSPYLFDVKYDQIAENSNKWSLEMNNQDNPDKYVEPEKPEEPDVPTPPTPELPDIPSIKPQPLPGSDRPVAPEVIGAESLPAAALAQTTNMIYNIMQKVSSNRFYCPGCGFYDYYWNGEAFHNLWANAVYNTLRIKTPTDIDAEVWGIEAGGDLQHDLNNKLGLFLSYRKGNYDMDGDGKHHYSTIGSEIDIDSYLAGLYYRYDRNNWWTFATVYGGIQKVDLKTKDGIKSDTDGVEFGGSIELGYDYAVNKTVYLTPSVGAFYTQVDYDDARDSAGKVAKYNTLRQLELEAGVKLTKAFVMDEGYANLYVKPSVVRTITDGDEVRITGLGKVNTLEDQTLGRIEVGGRYGFTEQLSAYGWANHTFGDDYKASTVGLGLSYNW